MSCKLENMLPQLEICRSTRSRTHTSAMLLMVTGNTDSLSWYQKNLLTMLSGNNCRISLRIRSSSIKRVRVSCPCLKLKSGVTNHRFCTYVHFY